MELIHELNHSGSLKIIQDSELNLFSFDSILLANFVRITKRSKNIVELCAGNCPVSILVADRYKDVKIKAIELQSSIAELGSRSVALNGLDDSIEVINMDLIGIANEIGSNCYNVVICNPPYFKLDDTSNLKASKTVAIARHELCVTINQIFEESRKLLDNMGYLYLVFRPQRLDELIIAARDNNFVIKQLQFVYPKINEQSNTILVELKKGSGTGSMKVLKPLVIHNEDDSYTTDALKVINGVHS